MQFKWHNPFKPKPAPPAFGKGKVLPEEKAPFLARLVFQWLSPFLDVGFSRPLERDDLWELPHSRQTGPMTDLMEINFYSRCPLEQRPASLKKRNSASKEKEEDAAKVEIVKEKVDPDQKDSTTPPLADEQKFESQKSVYDGSLVKALYTTFLVRWWISGILKLCSDTLNTTTPLLNKVILSWLTDSYIWHRATPEERSDSGLSSPRGIGYGISLAIALFVMQEVASLMMNHYLLMSMTTGLSIRTGLIGLIFRKSLRLSGRARLEHNVGQITTMISTDTTRLDRVSAVAHDLWIAPIQIAIGVGLLIGNLGYSALVGLAVLLLGFPIQLILVMIMFKQRSKGVKITDTRVRLTTEVLQGIRLIKFYAWEGFYTNQISNLRAREIDTIRKAAIAQSALISVMTLIPVLASVLSFITYSLSGHSLNVAIIFSHPRTIVILPIVLSSLADALVALGRISKFLTAEELAEPYHVDYTRKDAVEVDGDFTWETARKLEDSKFDVTSGGGDKVESESGQEDEKGEPEGPGLPTAATEGLGLVSESPQTNAGAGAEQEKPFELKNLKLNIPKGAFVAIVGRVGSGKSSILQALVGEMRRTRGEVVLGGTLAFVPQTPWIRNATLRENILFGQKEDEDKFRGVIHACDLDRDLAMLPHAEDTEIGEKGINLSGGQKARVSLARAAYSPSDIVLLDDPLSAVDSYVGKAILDNCLLHGPLANKTRILVTHSLHVLDQTDYIYVMENGQITEQGTYNELMNESRLFSRLMDEYGNLEQEETRQKGKAIKKDSLAYIPSEISDKRADAALMQEEERSTGSVSWSAYGKWLKFAGGLLWAPIILVLLTAFQGADVSTNLFLGFWTAGSINGFRQGDYMAVYASLGVVQAVFSFILSFGFAIMGLVASLSMFKAALNGVLRSPVTFFDTTPIRRILSRLSKDQDTLDTELTMTMMPFLMILSTVFGTAALVFYTFPLLGIIFAPLVLLYYIVSVYYRRSSVETKRLDSLMRSALYASYSETLTGLSTIRAYGEQDRSVKDAEHGLDLENRAYYMTIAIQRWLSVRLDIFGNILVFGIALFGAGFRNSVNPAKIGVVLSYTLSITQVLSELVSQFAQNEQNMNAVERILVYTELQPEGDAITSNDPPLSWPEQGGVKFTNVKFAYREDLPLVLKDVSFSVNPREKVGIVGRTGAGKSSLLQALFRLVNLRSGTIEIDGYDIRDMGLDILRHRLALVPQDSTLFLGTLRENIDPQGTRTDAELISALRRAWLLPEDGSFDPVREAKFSLDSTVGDEGANYSAGEKQLVALCRALVKNSRIIILDEATSSVDVETDSKLQRTIQTEFADSTLLCIAHRLNTIVYYDRVLVMDAGEIAEFDTVLNLYDKEGSIFRSLCNEAGLSRADILRIRADVVSPE